ncbi:hypothetical protein J1N35_013591 [Gossypium stocksii]|uniref:Uncharacterized protein n=1 Tax=Gossypium stocksii TaxID=47602 RepID=A0A9D3VSR2_9ROSI|nr:hypothetical protein J1N35_013591 [Gossypium stocksii]
MRKGDVSGKEMAKVTTGFEHITTIPKFKRRKVSAVWDFQPGCERGATTDHGLNRQIAIDQGSDDYEYLFDKAEGVYTHYTHIDHKSRNAEKSKYQKAESLATVVV